MLKIKIKTNHISIIHYVQMNLQIILSYFHFNWFHWYIKLKKSKIALESFYSQILTFFFFPIIGDISLN